MKISSQVIYALIRKDVIGLFPLVALTVLVLVLGVAAPEFLKDSGSPISALLVSTLPWLSTLTCCLLILSVFLLDPVVSLTHDWLTRPIARIDLLIAKLLFLAIVIFAPLISTSFIVSLLSGNSILESLLQATSIDAWWMFLLIPLLFMIAFLSGSLMHAFGNIIAAVIVLMVAAVFSPALPQNPNAVGDDGMTLGIQWIIIYPIAIFLMLLLLFVYWLQYQKKKTVLAGLVTAAGVLVTLSLIWGSLMLSAWPTMLSIQKAVVNSSDRSMEETLILEEIYGCFPSSVIGVASAGGSEEAQEIVGAEYWNSFLLGRAGEGAVTFATSVRSRGIPRDWRALSLHAKAIYELDSGNQKIELRPARFTNVNPFGSSNNTSTHYWLLPNDSLQEIKSDASTKMAMEHTIALLSPTTHYLETDNKRRYLPGIGYCSAALDEVGNQIEVDCFKRGTQPALISAELNDIPASRVDSSLPNYSPDWIEFLSGKQYELNIQTPNLVDHSTVQITAWKMEDVFTKQMSLPGILGGKTCQIPTLDNPSYYAQSNWSDSSPHEIRSISVDSGVRLEVLDWGGTGGDIVLLPGGGATAHSFDNLATKLAENHRVIGITRRGFGDSSKPYYGYDMDRLSEDILQVLTAMEIESPILIGHSLAGDELSTLGAKYPEKFSGLIYLDAAYDRSNTEQEAGEINRALPSAPAPVPNDFVSYDALLSFVQRESIGQTLMPEGEIMASYELSPRGTGGRTFDPRIADALMADIPPPDYANIPLPALAIYNKETSAQSYMRSWYDENDPAIIARVNKLYEIEHALKIEQIDKFDKELPRSEVIVLEDASHSIFISNEEEVLSAIEAFISRI